MCVCVCVVCVCVVCVCVCDRNDCEVSIQVWDTAGQERYKSITSTYYRGADGFFLVFDLTNRDSFRAVDIW